MWHITFDFSVGFISIILAYKNHHWVISWLVTHLSRGRLPSAHRHLLVGCGEVALRGLGLANRVGSLGQLKGAGVAVCVGGEHAHGLTGGVVDGELRAFEGVAVVSVGDGGIGAGLVDVQLTGHHAPANLEEAGTGLRVDGRDGHADDCLVAGDGEDAEVLA